jgi:TonB-dependent SusC/RagA subfamily outer membrane receptor
MKRGIIFLMILIVPFSCNLYAQKHGKKYYITGQVVDLNDKPVSGAIVLVDNQNTQIVTDNEGMYKVRVKPDATKIAVFKPANGQQDEEINGRTVINFRLKFGTSLHPSEGQDKPENEKVNIGYGYADKKDVSTTVSKIDVQNNKNAAYQTIYEMLQRDPSVQVNGNKIVIRGVNSVNSTDPLFVVDGMVVSSIDDISPSMVKSIVILKGSEASIYGSRGANGVIMITLTQAGNK